jgi:hypothetical protein
LDEIPQEVCGDLRDTVRAGLLRVHSKYLKRVDLTECLEEAFDVYAGSVQRAGWPLTEDLLNESIPAWVFQWAVARKWLPWPLLHHVPGRGKIRSSWQPIPESELTVQFGGYLVTDWCKADLRKRVASRIAIWQAEALVARAAEFTGNEAEPDTGDLGDSTSVEPKPPEPSKRGRPRSTENLHPEVEKYLARVGKKAGRRITIAEFCLVSGFADDTIFGYWRRGDSRCTEAHANQFRKTLTLSDEQFLAKLPEKHR